MLSIKNINIKYNDLVYDDAIFVCGNNQITTISGSSGSGKTTLLNIIALEIKENYEYDINGQRVDDRIFKNIYYCKQTPCFEKDLTVEENIELLCKFYNQNLDFKFKNSLLDELNIRHICHLYPDSLSVGEKKRLSLAIAIFVNCKIILLDEPTASVDEENQRIMCTVIKKYLSNRVTIISTHDQELLKIADVKYNIKDGKLFTNDVISDDNIVLNNLPNAHVEKIYWKTFKHHKFSNIFTQFMTILMVSLTVFGLLSTNKYLDTEKDILNEKFTNQFVVYSPLVNGNVYSLEEYPLSKKQVTALKKIKEIKSIRKQYCFTNSKSKAIKINGESILDEESNIYYVSYDDKKDNSKYIEKEIFSNGVYISKGLYEQIKDKTTNTLEFEMPVPQYNIFNDSYVAKGNDINEVDYYTVYQNENDIKVNLPIAGVIKDDSTKMGLTLNLNSYVIYIPQSIYESYLKKYEKKDSYVEGKAEYKPYQVNLYTVELNSMQDIDSFQKKLKKYNLATDSEYFDSLAYYKAIKNTNEFQKQIIFGISIGMIIIVFTLKYLGRKDSLEFFNYLKMLKAKKKEIHLLQGKCFLIRGVITSLISIILYFMIILFLNITTKQDNYISIVSIFMIFFISLFVEFLPLLFYRDTK